jgi:hypothetical protein
MQYMGSGGTCSMCVRLLPVVVLAGAILLGSCASPYFVHDPRTLVVDREEVPRLLKSLRCELITFIAANNQHNMMFQAEAKLHGIRSAIEKYSYYEIDWKQFGVMDLSLQVQDNLGLQSGTQFDWIRTNGGGHSHAWNIGPTGADQSTYVATWYFAVPQDAITLPPAPAVDPRKHPFSCYAKIPKRNPAPFGSVYTQDDLDALARDDFPDYALFKRVRVNNTTPLAAWLEEVGTSISDATLHGTNPQQRRDQIVPAQMQYQFQVVVSGGLDVKYNLASPLWPMVAADVSGSMQKTNTITIILNGIDSQATYAAQYSGGATNTEAPKALPTINVGGSTQGLPAYVGRKHPRGRPSWPYILSSPPVRP